MYSNLPLVSIVTPNYNYGKFIGDTIASVLKQDYPNIEYIIVDDNSTDNSISIINDFLKKNQNKIKLITRNAKGQSSAINHGFQNSNGEILCWLNSDDMLEPSAISIAVDFLLRHKNVDMVFGERVDIDEKGNLIRINRGNYWGSWHFKYHQPNAQEASFWRREIFFDCNMIDESHDFCMDYDLFIRFQKKGKIAFLPIHLGYLRIHKEAKNVKVFEGRWEKGYDEIDQMFKKHYNSKRPRLMKRLLSSKIPKYLCSKYWRFIRLNDTRRAEKVREDGLLY